MRIARHNCFCTGFLLSDKSFSPQDVEEKMVKRWGYQDTVLRLIAEPYGDSDVDVDGAVDDGEDEVC